MKISIGLKLAFLLSVALMLAGFALSMKSSRPLYAVGVFEGGSRVALVFSLMSLSSPGAMENAAEKSVLDSLPHNAFAWGQMVACTAVFDHIDELNGLINILDPTGAVRVDPEYFSEDHVLFVVLEGRRDFIKFDAFGTVDLRGDFYRFDEIGFDNIYSAAKRSFLLPGARMENSCEEMMR